MDKNPYIGPRAFRDGEKLYGRDREVVELLDLLIAERIVLLHSPSGAGKTSLIQAALVPELRNEGFHILPILRVSSGPSPEEGRGIAMKNRYVLSTLMMAEKRLPPEARRPLAELARLSLTEYFTKLLESLGPERNVVLILDQFEEILTINPTDTGVKEAYFEQLGAILRNQRCWALFSMREDYVAVLEPYLRKIPTRLSNVFRLDLLGEQVARKAIQGPALGEGIVFKDDAAQKLVNDLRTVRVQQADGTMQEPLGQYVEPVHLQVVCYQLWDKLAGDAKTIEVGDIQTSGDVNAALAGYYADRVREIALETNVSERVIRGWFNDALITEQGIRGQVLHTPGSSQGLADDVIWSLIDAHLVRAEKRRGATWFELAHDRLIKPVQADNSQWFEENLQPFQRQAELWERQKRPDGLLLHDAALLAAQHWAAANDAKLTPSERDFLRDSQDAKTSAEREQERLRVQAERDRQQAGRFRRLAYLTSAVSILSIILLMWALYNKSALAAAAEKINQTNEELTRKQADLEQKQMDLDRTLSTLNDTNLKLTGKNVELNNTLTALDRTNKDLITERNKAREAQTDAERQARIAAENLEIDKTNRLGAQAYQRGELTDAIDHFRGAKALYERKGNAGGVGWALSNIGLSLRGLGRYDEASRSYSDSLSIMERPKNDPLQMLSTLDGLAQLKEAQGDREKDPLFYAEAGRHYLRALDIREKYGDKYTAGTANNLEALGTIYLKQNAYDKAVDFYKRAVEVKALTFGWESLEIADTYDKLGYTYRQARLTFGDRDKRWEGAFFDALDYYTKALYVRKKFLFPYHEEIEANLASLSTLYREMSYSVRDERGTTYRRRSQELDEVLNAMRQIPRGPDTEDKVRELFEVASILRQHERMHLRRNEGVNYEDAIWFYEHAVEMEKRLAASPSASLAEHLHDVAYFYAQIGMADKAVDYYRQEIEFRRKILQTSQAEGDKYDLISSLDGLAAYYNELGKSDEAKELYMEAVREAEPLIRSNIGLLDEEVDLSDRERTEKQDDVAWRARWAADVYFLLSRDADAEPLYQRAVAFWKKLIGPGKRLEYSKAVATPAGSLTDETRSLISTAFSVNVDEYMSALDGLNSLYVRQKKDAEAEAIYKEAVDMLEWYGKAFSAGIGRADWPTIRNPLGTHEMPMSEPNNLSNVANCLNTKYYRMLAAVYEDYAKFLAKLEGRAGDAEKLKALAENARADEQRQRTTPCY